MYGLVVTIYNTGMPLDQTMFEITVLMGVGLAGAARTVIPYLAKRQGDVSEGRDPRPFSWAYVATALLAVIPVAVGTILLFPVVLPQVANSGTPLMIFATSFGLGYAATDIVNRNVSTLNIPGLLSTDQAVRRSREGQP